MSTRVPMPEIIPDDDTTTTNDQPVENSRAHLERNDYMEGWAPPTYPVQLPSFNPATGLTIVADDQFGEQGWHGGNECVRIMPDMQTVQELRADPQYREDFDAMAGSHDFDVDEVIPGAQACYDPHSGALVQDGPYVGTWDYASPTVPGQTLAHFVMDVLPDSYADNYTPAAPAAPIQMHAPISGSPPDLEVGTIEDGDVRSSYIDIGSSGGGGGYDSGSSGGGSGSGGSGGGGSSD